MTERYCAYIDCGALLVQRPRETNRDFRKRICCCPEHGYALRSVRSARSRQANAAAARAAKEFKELEGSVNPAIEAVKELGPEFDDIAKKLNDTTLGGGLVDRGLVESYEIINATSPAVNAPRMIPTSATNCSLSTVTVVGRRTVIGGSPGR